MKGYRDAGKQYTVTQRKRTAEMINQKITWCKALCIINRLARESEGLEEIALEMAASVVADHAYHEMAGQCIEVERIKGDF